MESMELNLTEEKISTNDAAPKCSKGWEPRCANGKRPKCTCKCGGRNHGKAKMKNQSNGIDKQVDFKGEIYFYAGFWGCEAKCGLNIIKNDDKAIVIFTELPDNHGTSVTNFIENLATQIYHKRLNEYPIENIRFIEHYIYEGIAKKETFDLVDFEWDGKTFCHPRWKRFSKKTTQPEAIAHCLYATGLGGGGKGEGI